MFRAVRVWVLRVGLLALVLFVGFSAGGFSAVIGYALLLWVLVRAAPGCAVDLRAVWAMTSPWLSPRALRSGNSTF